MQLKDKHISIFRENRMKIASSLISIFRYFTTLLSGSDSIRIPNLISSAIRHSFSLSLTKLNSILFTGGRFTLAESLPHGFNFPSSPTFAPLHDVCSCQLFSRSCLGSLWRDMRDGKFCLISLSRQWIWWKHEKFFFSFLPELKPEREWNFSIWKLSLLLDAKEISPLWFFFFSAVLCMEGKSFCQLAHKKQAAAHSYPLFVQIDLKTSAYVDVLYSGFARDLARRFFFA